jgi:hypothetical protein
MIGGNQVGYKHFDENMFASFLKDGIRFEMKINILIYFFISKRGY